MNGKAPDLPRSTRSTLFPFVNLDATSASYPRSRGRAGVNLILVILDVGIRNLYANYLAVLSVDA